MLSADLTLPLILLWTLADVQVFACDAIKCSEVPVFSPPTLVVKYGDPTSATCVVCKDACLRSKYSLEVPFGSQSSNGTTLTWTVDNVTQWDLSALCYYNTISQRQCCTELPVTVYQPPESVSVSAVNHTGPMLEDEEYNLRCTVRNVAPIQNLTVTFYRGQRSLGVATSKATAIGPVTETFSLNTKPSRDDDGVKLRCEAELELGPEGPQHPVIVTSAEEEVDATVYYGPYLEVPANPSPIVITQGEILQLNCSAEGNPPPSYAWTLPSDNPTIYNRSVFIATSVGFEREGQYICRVTGIKNAVEVKFSVDVRVNVVPYIIIGVVAAVTACLVLMACYYKQRHRGKYTLIDTCCFCDRHAPGPDKS